MRLKLTVAKELRRERFASPWTIILFSLMMGLALWVFYPEDDLLLITQESTVNPVLAAYLENIIELYPDNIDMRVALARQQLALNEFNKAKATLQPLLDRSTPQYNKRAAWIHYQVTRTEVYAYPEGSKERREGLKEMKKSLHGLLNARLSANELSQLAEDALYVGDIDFAMKVYARLARLRPDTRPEVFEKAAKIALGRQHYRNSAQYFFLAQEKSLNFNDKKKYFISALKSYQSGNMVVEAVEVAPKHLDDRLANDYDTVMFLTKLALEANKSQVAEHYIKQALRIKRARAQ